MLLMGVKAQAQFNQQLQSFMTAAEQDTASIQEERKATLQLLATRMADVYNRTQKHPQLVFICTHNSRRSHIARITAFTAAKFLGFDINTASGGTEVTAFNPRAIAALNRIGYDIKLAEGNTNVANNPRYWVGMGDTITPITEYSKRYDEAIADLTSSSEQGALSAGIIAVMTCSDADKACPAVQGADYRIAVSYLDPKRADGTINESQVYDETVRLIMTEMLYMLRLYKNSLSKKG